MTGWPKELRRDRHKIIGLDGPSFEEMCSLIQSRNSLHWLEASFDPGEMQFVLNGLWFELPFRVFPV